MALCKVTVILETPVNPKPGVLVETQRLEQVLVVNTPSVEDVGIMFRKIVAAVQEVK